MDIVRVKGTITPEGEIKVELPEGWQPGEVEVAVPVAVPEEAPFTEAELAEMMRFEGRSLGEIETGGWEDMDIPDSAEWVEEQRRKEQERRGNWTP